MSTLPTSPLPPDPHMCSSDEEQTRSPLSLYSEYQRMDIELRSPHAMPASHWHGQVEINVPFDGDVETDTTFVGGKEKNEHADKRAAGSQGGAN